MGGRIMGDDADAADEGGEEGEGGEEEGAAEIAIELGAAGAGGEPLDGGGEIAEGGVVGEGFPGIVKEGCEQGGEEK